MAVSSNLSVASPDVSPFTIFISCIPWNFYAIFCLCFVFIIVAMDFDFGPMRRAELRARTAPPEQTVEDESKADAGGKRPADRRDALIDMLAPLFCLICVTFIAMLYSGGYWGREDRSISEAMGNTDSSLSLILGALAGLLCVFKASAVTIHPLRSNRLISLTQALFSFSLSQTSSCDNARPPVESYNVT